VRALPYLCRAHLTPSFSLAVYPKPFIGVHFDYEEANPLTRKASEGMGVWKVKVKEGRDLKDGDNIFAPDMYIKVEILGCMDVMLNTNEASSVTTSTYDSNMASMEALYGKPHAGATARAKRAPKSARAANAGGNNLLLLCSGAGRSNWRL
jgi:hypothetical protein